MAARTAHFLYRRMRDALLTGFLLLLAAPSPAQSVTRGPYLQLAAPSSAVVRWRTDLPTDSRVRYGASTATLTSFTDALAPVTEHAVELAGLAPDTTYFYSVGTTGAALAGAETSYFLVTAPAAGTAKPTRIWVLGDPGVAGLGPAFAADQASVRDAYAAYAGTRHTDLWLLLGDNAYPSGTDAEYQAGFFDVYPEMLRKSPVWPTPGNHDYESASAAAQSGPYYDAFTLPTDAKAGGLPSGTEAYYSFDYGNIHFVSLDSFGSPRSPTGAMMTWLAADLAATRQDWIIAYWHHPPYSRDHDSDREPQLVEMRESALPILEQHGVDLVLTGHSHSYERSFLIRGHFGPSSTFAPSMLLDRGDGRIAGTGPYRKPTEGPLAGRGTVHVVTGSAGQVSGGNLNHPVMRASFNDVLGSVALDVDGGRLDAVFLDNAGAVRDSFTIVKGGSSSAPEADNIRVYPVPYRPRNRRTDDGRPYSPIDPLSGITFDLLPEGASIRVYSMTGRVVAELSSDRGGLLRWDAKDRDGRELPTGAYVAVIRAPGRSAAVRKILIAR